MEILLVSYLDTWQERHTQERNVAQKDYWSHIEDLGSSHSLREEKCSLGERSLEEWFLPLFFCLFPELSGSHHPVIFLEEGLEAGLGSGLGIGLGTVAAASPLRAVSGHVGLHRHAFERLHRLQFHIVFAALAPLCIQTNSD